MNTPRSQENHGEALLPCPWCGSEAVTRDYGAFGFKAGCRNDECKSYVSLFSDKSAAENAWNTRAPSHRAAVVTVSDEMVQRAKDAHWNAMHVDGETPKECMRAALAAALGGGEG